MYVCMYVYCILSKYIRKKLWLQYSHDCSKFFPFWWRSVPPSLPVLRGGWHGPSEPPAAVGRSGWGHSSGAVPKLPGLVNVYKKRWENHGKTMGKWWFIWKDHERSTMLFMGHFTISTGPFSMSLFVCLPEGNFSIRTKLVGGDLTILKNDGVRQWEGWHPIYDMENRKGSKPPTRKVLQLAFINTYHVWHLSL